MNLRRFNIKVILACLALGICISLPRAALAESLPADVQGGKEIQKAPAGDPNPAKAGEQLTSVSLEQAIRIAKEAFAVPEGFNQFSTGFNQSDNKSFWDLRWYRSGDPGGEMNVRVNAETGEIWSMYLWIPPAPGQDYQGLPKYTREQAESAAAALAEKLQPERFKLTRLQPAQDYDYQPLTFKIRGQIEYNYNYARIVDGVPYPENGINIAVSGDTGQVTRFNLDWDDIKDFPAAAGRISREQAEQIFRAEAGPELFYFRPRTPGGKEVPLKLVYRLPGPQGRVVIDALTGKVLSKEDEFYAYYDMAGGGGGELKMPSMNRATVPLSPVEEVAVEEAKSLLSKEKALEMARSAVKVPGEYTLNSSRLEQDYQFKDNKTWHFNWEAGTGADRKGIEVAIDAATGELVSFNNNLYGGGYDYLKAPEVKFSEEAARKIAEEFIKKAQPAKWDKVVFMASRPEYGPVTDPEGKPLPRSYSFNWVRLANDTQFPQNGFYLDVNSTTGEITNYRMTWWDVNFPDPQGVISRDAAADKYLQASPLTAAYMRWWSHYGWKGPGESKIYLVYSLAQQNFAMLDAFTGQLLDYNGNVVPPSVKKQKFDDLAGHPAREAVELLAGAGIVAGGNGKFRPDDAITQAELITMLVKSSGQNPVMELRSGATTGKEPWYQSYYEAAARIGIIQAGENPDPDMAVTREVLARLTIHAMGFYKVARLSDIYVLNFQDAGDIPDYLRGHVALAVGLGLIDPVDGKFEPKAVVTRGEAAETLVKLLKSN